MYECDMQPFVLMYKEVDILHFFLIIANKTVYIQAESVGNQIRNYVVFCRNVIFC